jgi:two-component system, NarL family, invasion response regulator UvrY
MIKQVDLIKVAIAEDHTLVRKAFIDMINSFDNFKIIIEAANGKQLVDAVNANTMPNVLLMDIHMPDMDGFEAMNQIKHKFPHLNVLVVSMLSDELSILRMVRMGVKGYLVKDTEPSEFKTALETVATGKYYYSGYVTARMISSVNRETDIIKLISERELEFLKYVCTDLSYQQIADKMFVSPRTVDGYRDSLFQKLQVKNRVALALFAVKYGVVIL